MTGLKHDWSVTDRQLRATRIRIEQLCWRLQLALIGLLLVASWVTLAR